MYSVLTLNNISSAGLERLPADQYRVGDDVEQPDAIMLRSFKMHSMELPESLMAVGRAGAGTNNIPVEKMSTLGIPVFNAPGANANAVKELVIAGMLLSTRNICQAWQYVQNLEGTDEEVTKAVESGKKQYAGSELPGRTLAVVGLGAIGRLVANAALDLGMNVVGFDPGLTVDGALQLSHGVQTFDQLDQMLPHADFVSCHVPLNDHTRGLIGAEQIELMPKDSVVLNFARQGIVDDTAALAALDGGKLRYYICDFPSRQIKSHDKVIALPHLGASTKEAEDNCAVMVAEQLKDYLENGNIVNSVNFPHAVLRRTDGPRLIVINANVPNMVGQITTALADEGLNIVELLNKSRNDLAVTLVDVEQPVSDSLVERLQQIEGVLSVRAV